MNNVPGWNQEAPMYLAPLMGGGFTWAPVLPLFPGYRRMGPAYHTIRAILEQPDGARLALLHGNAGAGKSSLATDVGQGMTADGILAGTAVLHCDFLSSGQESLTVFRRAVERRITIQGPAPPRLLVVLDNAEGRLRDENLRAILGLRDSHPSLMVLITSRRPWDQARDGPRPAGLREVPVEGLGSEAMYLLLRGACPHPLATNTQLTELAAKCVPSATVARLSVRAIVQGRLSARDAVRAANHKIIRLLLLTLTPLQLSQLAKLAIFQCPFSDRAAAAVWQCDASHARQQLRHFYSCELLVATDTPGLFSVAVSAGEAAEELAAEKLPSWEDSKRAAEAEYVRFMLHQLGSWADLYYTPQYVMSVMGRGKAAGDIGQAITWLQEGRVQLGPDLVPLALRLAEPAVWATLNHLVPDMPYTGLTWVARKLEELGGGNILHKAAAVLIRLHVKKATSLEVALLQLFIKAQYREVLELLDTVAPDNQDALHKTLIASCLLGMAACDVCVPDWWGAHRHSCEAQVLLEEVLGVNHPGTIQTILFKARSREGAGEAGAGELYMQASQLGEQLLGGAHPETSQARKLLAAWLWSQGRRQEALELGYVQQSTAQRVLQCLPGVLLGSVGSLVLHKVVG